MQDKSKRTPLIEPLLLALKSRRVIVALVTLIVGAAVALVPALDAVQGELLTLLLTLGLALIGGYSIEDAAGAARQQPVPADDDDLRHLVRDVIDGVLDELEIN